MNKSTFVYVTYIRTTPQKLWSALIDPEFNRQYWFGAYQESLWTPGAAWKLLYADGSATDAGEVVEIDPPRRLVLKWRNEFRPELKAEGYARCTMTLEPVDQTVKLTILHEMEQGESKFIGAVGKGWPMILSNLKSLLETGKVALVEKPAA
jgi:uncharacterized protein YndB with AHSA1/START domain